MPKQFLKSIRRSGFGPNLFDDLRYLDEGVPDADNSTRPLNPDFPLNFPRYQGASILLARENFGCGSSREHAPWALVDYGFRAIIAPSFADIFRSNCFKNGLLPIALDSSVVDRLFAALYEKEGFSLSIDLERQMIAGSGFDGIGFEVDAFRKDCLLKGLDDIGITLQSEEAIRRFETGHKELFPWVFDKVSI
jgi:3-isopropylmalate/(R)-2-methylmalate dehydratase small subunit